MLRICSLFVLILGVALPVAAGTFSGPVRVHDGDTFDVGAVRVRLHGVDAPELGQPCTNPDGVRWDCGTWVAGQVRARLDGRKVDCEKLGEDRHGRTLARCALAGRDIGRMLVEEGLVLAYRRYSMEYDLDEKRAVVAGHGLHGSLMTTPEEYRRVVREERAASRSAPDVGCLIKGNINSKGRRIYHLPGQENYQDTVIRPKQGERWFCSEAEARAAGWQAAKR